MVGMVAEACLVGHRKIGWRMQEKTVSGASLATRLSLMNTSRRKSTSIEWRHGENGSV